MRAKPGLLIAVALVCGLGAMYGANQILSRPSTAAPEMREVLVATRDLNLEEVIREDMLVVDKLPVTKLPSGTFDDAKNMLGRWVQVKMFKGEPIVEAKLAPIGTPEGMVSRIPVGMRALAVEVNEQTGVSGFILPMHRVDVIQNKLNTGPGASQAETILQDLLVLASGRVMTRTDDKSIDVRSVTLAVTPEQADDLVAARNRGAISLALRGLNDHSKAVRPDPPKAATVPVVVALRDLAPREAINPGMVEVRQMVKGKAPADAASDPGAITGRKLKVAVAAGSPITEGGLSPKVAAPLAAKPEPPPDFHSRIAAGMRAFLLLDEEHAGLKGLLNGDSRVDVLYTRTAANGAAPVAEAEPLVQDARVLVMASPIDPTGDSPAPQGPLALEVPLAEAMRLTAARAAGKLSLTLRGVNDGGRWVSERRPTVTIYRGPPGRAPSLEILNRGSASGRYDRRTGSLPETTAARGGAPGSGRPN